MGFLQPAILIGLSLVAIPLILHLFTRRRLQQVMFPAMMLLAGSKRRSLLRLTLQQWLVLLSRIAAIGLIALAFAQPVLHNARLSLPGTRDRVALHIIVDNSPSMSWERGGVTLLERAKYAAEKLAEAAAHEDEVSVEPGCGEPSVAGSAARIAKMPAGDCHAQLDLKINRAIYDLRQSPASERRLVVLSDFQANGFGLKPPAARKGDPVIIGALLAEGAARSNAWIAGVETPLFPLTGEEAPICFRLAESTPAKTQVAVSLEIDGRKRGELTVAPGPKGTAHECFSLTFGEAGRHSGRLSVSGDALKGDNDFYFTFDVHEGIPIALIADEESARDATQGAFYIARAARTVSGVGGAVRLTLIPPAALSVQALSKSRVAIVPDAGALTSSGIAALGEFVAGGGGLFIAAGGAAQNADTIARAFFEDAVSISVPKVITSRSNESEGDAYLSIGEMEASHPLFESLSGKAGAAFKETRFKTPAKVKLLGADVPAPATLADGNALIAERRFGRGRILLFASSLDPDSTNLPLKPVFVPFVIRLLKYLGDPYSGEPASFTLGGNLRIRIDAPENARKLTAKNIVDGTKAELVKTPAGSRDYFAPRAGAAISEGVYEVRSDDGNILSLFAVNGDPREGKLDVLAPDEFKKIFSDYNAYALNSGRFTDVDRLSKLIYTRRAAALWFPALLGAILLLFAEMILSNRR